jgi:hypothetical protein
MDKRRHRQKLVPTERNEDAATIATYTTDVISTVNPCSNNPATTATYSDTATPNTRCNNDANIITNNNT